MRRLTVSLGDHSYSVLIGDGILARAGDTLLRLGLRVAPVLIGDARVLSLHGKPLLHSLRQTFGPLAVIRIPGGEGSKNHTTLLRVYSALLRHKAHRGSWIVSFGGGVVGDLAGFAAATFLRGIPYVQIPTTLAAQVDSSVGGKVGVNLAQGKNLVGAFHQPYAVLTDTRVLRSLSKRDLAAGLYEVIKCGAIGSAALVRYLEANLDAILACEARPLEHIVVEACRIKARVVSRDERELELRMVLNFGHTIGHAMEAATGYRRFRHGEAVAWGMIAALEFGEIIGLAKGSWRERLTRLIHRVGPLPSLKGIRFEEAWRCLEHDKKFRGGQIRMVLLSELESPEIVRGINTAMLRSFVKSFLTRFSHQSRMRRGRTL